MSTLPRTLFTEEHEAFREVCATFVEKECVPNAERWQEAGIVDREVWTKAGEHGLLGTAVPTEYGGGGMPDYRFNMVLNEEMTKRHVSGPGFAVHNDVLWPYLELANEEQRQRWLPGFCDGSIITAVAMSEPAAGSDLQGIKTTAVKQDDGSWLLNGSKTFITNGILSDLVVVFAKTDPEAGHMGFSLLVVERGMEGFERGRNLDKIGLKDQDTAELFFDNVTIPAENLLGTEGHGFLHLMNNLPQERLCISVIAATAVREILNETIQYCREREAFGRSIGKFQHIRFELAEMATEADVCTAYIDRCVELHVAGELDHVQAAKAKWWSTELQKRTVDRCLQLFGGYGYMTEFPISKAFVDSRIQTIYGGTTEIMKEIVGRAMGF
ncbi:MAG: acyl-CoA dehydrogenase family protein [Nitriliruptorales bacterium]|nr:acyl-CoA dehydrogenase family protein [Nitriliruptorales bacterium]